MTTARRRFAGLLAAAAIGASGPAAAGQSGPVPLVVLSTADIGGLLQVELDVAGQRSRWLLDTGSSRHLVTPALVRRLDLDVHGRVNADTAYGRLAGPGVTLPDVTLGAMPLGAVSAVVLELRPLVGSAADGIDGVLGAPLLDGGSVTLDLREGLLHVSSSTAQGCAEGSRELPLERRRGVPVLSASVNGAAPERAILDTGNPGAWVRVEADDAALPPGTPVPGLPASLARADDIDWGGVLVRRGVPVTQLRSTALRSALPADVDSLAGVAFIEGARLTLDLSRRRACVEPDARTVPGSFGFTLDQRGDELVVTGVLDGGPAQAAGLRAGDVVARWGAAPPPRSVADAWAQLRGQSRLDAGFARAGVNRSVELKRAPFLPALTP